MDELGHTMKSVRALWPYPIFSHATLFAAENDSSFMFVYQGIISIFNGQVINKTSPELNILMRGKQGFDKIVRREMLSQVALF